MVEIQPVARRTRRPTRLRRTIFGAGIIAAVAAIAVTLWIGHAARRVRVTDVMLLYVGAEDCAPCRAWQGGDGAAFFASPEFPRITYREVKSARLHDLLKDENWPDELRPYRDRLRRSDGVPLWLIIANQKIVQHRFGAAEWRTTVRPAIESLLR